MLMTGTTEVWRARTEGKYRGISVSSCMYHDLNGTEIRIVCQYESSSVPATSEETNHTSGATKVNCHRPH